MPTLNETGVLKLPNKDRASGTARTQNPTRQRKPYVKLSDQELLKQKEKRDEFTARFDAALENAKERIWDIMEDLHAEVPERTAEWWHTYLMQQSKCSKKSKQRAYSTWQAFISLESEKVNSEGEEFQQNATKLTELTRERLRDLWRKMTPEEKRSPAILQRQVELEERREGRARGVRNLPLAQFMDIRETFDAMCTEMENVHDRTAVEIFFLACRSDVTMYNKPVIHYSSERMKRFIETITGATMADVGIRSEAYCIGGVEGMVSSQLEKTLLIKAQLASLILSKLQSTCKRGVIKRMFYPSFDDQITAKHGVVLENWPVPQFRNPSGMTHLEAEVVLRAFVSNTTRFRSMPGIEWAAWKEQYYSVARTTPTQEEEDGVHIASLSRLAEASDDAGFDADADADAAAPSSPPITDQSGSIAIDNTQAVTQPEPALPPSSAPSSSTSASQKRPSENDDGAAAKRMRTTEAQRLADTTHPLPEADVLTVTVSFLNSSPPAAGAAYKPPKARKAPAAENTGKAPKARKKRSDANTKRTKKAGENVTPAEGLGAGGVSSAAPAVKPKPKPRAVKAAASTAPPPASNPMAALQVNDPVNVAPPAPLLPPPTPTAPAPQPAPVAVPQPAPAI